MSPVEITQCDLPFAARPLLVQEALYWPWTLQLVPLQPMSTTENSQICCFQNKAPCPTFQNKPPSPKLVLWLLNREGEAPVGFVQQPALSAMSKEETATQEDRLGVPAIPSIAASSTEPLTESWRVSR